MMIAAAVNENSFDAVIPETLDNAKGILLFDVEQPLPEKTILVTDDIVKAMVEAQCEAVLCGVIYDANLFDRIADNGITRYFAAGMTVREAVPAMENYELDMVRDYFGGTGCHGHQHG